jgi:hypothetical protein
MGGASCRLLVAICLTAIIVATAVAVVAALLVRLL